MSKITITRSSEWNNRLREIGIYVNDEKVGTIANGETKSFELAPGTYRIKAKIDWAYSQELSFYISEESERKYFRLSGYRGSKVIAPLVLAIVVLHIILRRTTGFDQLIWLALIPFVYMMYFITLGRNQYLRLEEKDSWDIN